MKFFRERLIQIPFPNVSKEELRASLGVPKTQLQFLATIDLLTELERDAIQGAQASIASPGISAGCLGGAEWLGIARVKLAKAREEAFGA